MRIGLLVAGLLLTVAPLSDVLSGLDLAMLAVGLGLVTAVVASLEMRQARDDEGTMVRRLQRVAQIHETCCCGVDRETGAPVHDRSCLRHRPVARAE